MTTKKKTQGKKRKNVKPTIKQKLAFAKLAENGGNISKTMKEVGYSAQTAKTPGKLTKSIGWQQLMEKYLPDKMLAEKHRALLNKQEVIVKNNNTTKEIDVIKTGEIDPYSVKNGLDLAYKLKGRFAPEQIELTKRKYQGLSNRELAEVISKMKTYFSKRVST